MLTKPSKLERRQGWRRRRGRQEEEEECGGEETTGILMSATEGGWEKADKGSLPQDEEGIHTRVYGLNSTKGASLAGYCSRLDTWWTDSFPTASLGGGKKFSG